MNDEEKKAVEFVKKRTKELKKYAKRENELCYDDIVLNLIEKLQKENEKFKKERQIVGMPVRNKRDGRIGIVLHQWESGSVAVLESINPRVINTHDSWNTLEIVTDEVKDGNDTNVGSI